MNENRPSRSERSLRLLTSQFINLLRKTPDGVLDLQKAANTFDAGQRRRIYDITNVLEGIGIIEKTSKNSIQWKRVTPEDSIPGRNTQERAIKVGILKDDLKKLDEYERILDQHRAWIEQSIRNTAEDGETNRYLYLTDSDLDKIYDENQTVIAVNASIDRTNVEVTTENNANVLKIKSSDKQITAHVFERNHNRAVRNANKHPRCSKRVNLENEEQQKSDNPHKKKKRQDKKDSTLMAAAEILFKKASNDLPKRNVPHEDDVPFDNEIESFLRLSPLLFDNDYNFSLLDNEGALDLFDDIEPIT